MIRKEHTEEHRGAIRPARAQDDELRTLDSVSPSTTTGAETERLRLIERNIRELVSEELGAEIRDADPSDPTLSYRIERRVYELLSEGDAAPMTAAQRARVVDDVVDDMLGLGPLQVPLDDVTVTAIMVNGPETVFVERGGVYEPAARRFDGPAHVRDVIDRLLLVAGCTEPLSSPTTEARLPDGSRVNIVLPPLAADGPVLSIQKSLHDSFSAEDLISFGTLDEHLAEFLRACVAGRLNVLVSGATGSGRTTLLNVMGSWIPDDERIITLEDAPELRLDKPHVVRLETQVPDACGEGAIGMRELTRTAMRMHADRLLVGEVRGDEAFEMLLAMGSGDDGWMSTIYAGSPADALTRFETLALLAAGPTAPVHALRDQVSSAFDLVVHVERMKDGTRRIVHVSEVGDPTDDGIALRDLFFFEGEPRVDSTGRIRGRFVSTGIIPVFADRLDGFEVVTRQLGFGV